MILAGNHKGDTILLKILPYSTRMFFVLFIADTMGENESLERRQSLCQVIKSSVCPKQDRTMGAERVSLRNNGFLIPFFACGQSLLLPRFFNLRAAIVFLWCFQAFVYLSMWSNASCLIRYAITGAVFMFRMFLMFKKIQIEM